MGSLQRPRADDGHRAGIFFLLLATFGFACLDASAKVAVADYSIVQILWTRYLFLTLLAWRLGAAQGFAGTLRSKRRWLQGGNALLLVMESATFVAAFSLLPLADVHAVAAASPLFVMALAAPLLGEKVGPRRWVAVGIGFFGVLLIVRPGLRAVDAGTLLPLAGALMWALYQIGVRANARNDSANTTLLWTGVVGLAATSLALPFVWKTPDLRGAALLLLIALIGSLAQLALIKAFEHAEASALQPFSYALVVWAALMGFLVFGDVPGMFVVAGAVIVVGSGVWVWTTERRR